jgi:hypothetical protein
MVIETKKHSNPLELPYGSASEISWTILYYDGLVPCRYRRTGVCTILMLKSLYVHRRPLVCSTTARLALDIHIYI